MVTIYLFIMKIMQRTAQTHSLTHTHEKKIKIKIKYDKTLERNVNRKLQVPDWMV